MPLTPATAASARPAGGEATAGMSNAGAITTAPPKRSQKSRSELSPSDVLKWWRTTKTVQATAAASTALQRTSCSSPKGAASETAGTTAPPKDGRCPANRAALKLQPLQKPRSMGAAAVSGPGLQGRPCGVA